MEESVGVLKRTLFALAGFERLFLGLSAYSLVTMLTELSCSKAYRNSKYRASVLCRASSASSECRNY